MYNPYDLINPYQMPIQRPIPPVPQMEVTKVNGEPGAQAFQMGPNSSALLLDATAPLVWLVQTDGAGYKTCTPYTVTPYKQEPPVNPNDLKTQMDDLTARLVKIEERMNANGQPNSGNAGKKQSYNDGYKSNDRNG